MCVPLDEPAASSELDLTVTEWAVLVQFLKRDQEAQVARPSENVDRARLTKQADGLTEGADHAREQVQR
jgi:hypothetical protein